MPPFDLNQILDLLPLAMSAIHPGSPQAAAMMRGYQTSQARMRQEALQKQQADIQQQAAARQDQMAQAQIGNMTADNARADQEMALRRLQTYGGMDQNLLGSIEKAPAEDVMKLDPLQAQNALTVQRLMNQQATGTMGQPQGPLPNMTALVSNRKKKQAQDLYQRAEKTYGPEAMASDSIVIQTGDQFGDVKPSQLRAMFEMPAVTAQGAPALPDTGKRTPAAPGSLEDYVLKKYGQNPTADQLLEGKTAYTKAGQRPAVNLNPAGQSAITDQAQQLVDGNIVPSMMSKRSSSFNDTLAEANRLSKEQTGKPINLLELETQYRAAQQFARSQNGSQATRFRSLGKSVVNTINEVRDLADELKQGGLQAWNRAKRGTILQVYGNTPQSETAARYVAAVNTLKEEFAGLIQGGYAPTESAFALANQQINGDYGVKDLNAAITEVQRLINYRLGSFETLGPLLPGQTPEAPAAGSGNFRVVGSRPVPAR